MGRARGRVVAKKKMREVYAFDPRAIAALFDACFAITPLHHSVVALVAEQQKKAKQEEHEEAVFGIS